MSVCAENGESHDVKIFHVTDGNNDDVLSWSKPPCWGVPAAMMFVQSLHGISHNKVEDTKEEHLELCVAAFDKLAEKVMGWIVRK